MEEPIPVRRGKTAILRRIPRHPHAPCHQTRLQLQPIDPGILYKFFNKLEIYIFDSNENF